MKKILSLVLLIAVLFSCSKSDNKKTCTQDMASIAGTYKVTAATYKVTSSSPETDILSTTLYLKDCQKDDITVLSAAGTLTYTDAGTKCSPAGDHTGTWSVSGSTITIDGRAFTILSFDCSSIVGTASSALVPGDLVKVTFTKQ